MKMDLLFIRIIMLSVFVSIFTTCEKMRHQRYALVLKNNSEEEISVHVGLPETGNGVYPDTLLPSKKQLTSIKPQGKGYWDSSIRWEDGYFKELPNDTLSVYILNRKISDTKDWDVIRENYMILQRYDLSIYDLQKLDYTLYYPPTEAMRNMKMWPAYKAERD